MNELTNQLMYYPPFLDDSRNFINMIQHSVFKSYGGGRYYYSIKRHRRILFMLKNHWLPQTTYWKR